ncbi:unnamed protein product [Mytilus coruscus]|uniref:Tyr recombinase domain-containing protein n=1 Tax=Mytilus coruscus TaxID=42192 RepID=A0A6J8EJA0_MYTCO|nr:unnamed protein product [Mytilus coruscus]
MYDTGLNELKDFANTIVTLPLTADGIVGSQFDAKMKEKTDRNKQLAEVLPDTRRITLGSQLGKRKPTTTITSKSTFVKKPKFDNNFKIPKKNFGEFKSSGKQTAAANKTWEAYPITSTSFLETLHQRSHLSNSIYTTPKKSFELVVGQSKHYQGQIITPVVGNRHNNNRCFKDGVWGSLEQSDFSRFLVCSRTETTNKSVGIGSCNSNSTTFPTTITKSKCAAQMRQHNSRSVCEQAGGHKVNTPLLQDMVSNENGNSKQSDIQGSSYSGKIKYSCRSSVSKQNTTHRVDTEQPNCSISVCNVGRTNNRFVCLSTQSQKTSVLYMATSSQCSSSRCSVDIMGKNVGICISTNMSNSKGIKTHESVQLSTNSDSSKVAKKTLVHRASSKIICKSNKTANKAKSTVSTKHNHLPSKSRSVQADSLAALHKNFRNKGFSRETRKLLRASWRSGTQQDYACKFKRFNSWCSEREQDPYAATLGECADVLSQLYTSGLQYRTIAGCRSMLSSLLPPIDNVPIGQHPYMIRLLRGVFNSRPPKVNLVPEWDLQTVLDMLQTSPFEPLLKADVKCLTYKVVFLTAITTFRRCSDIQALRIGEGFVNVQKKGLVFLRPGLSKQDRPNHYATKIFVPYFEHNKKT